MKIALLGYGKMGKAIEAIALERGHSIAVTIDNEQEWSERGDRLEQCDIAIDFSQPDTAVRNIRRCIAKRLPIVVGTTGWYDQLETLKRECVAADSALFVASNFSIGMNIMFELNRKLAQLMNGRPEYTVSLSETHHVHKLDAPSGTAITLVRDAIRELSHKDKWVLNGELWMNPNGSVDDARSVSPKAPSDIPEDTIPVLSIRQGEVPGIHTMVYDSEVDTLTLSHSAKSRKGLAMGAVLAAEFLCGKKGYFTMKDLLA